LAVRNIAETTNAGGVLNVAASTNAGVGAQLPFARRTNNQVIEEL